MDKYGINEIEATAARLLIATWPANGGEMQDDCIQAIDIRNLMLEKKNTWVFQISQ